jgi:hypothetical protein
VITKYTLVAININLPLTSTGSDATHKILDEHISHNTSSMIQGCIHTEYPTYLRIVEDLSDYDKVMLVFLGNRLFELSIDRLILTDNIYNIPLDTVIKARNFLHEDWKYVCQS